MSCRMIWEYRDHLTIKMSNNSQSLKPTRNLGLEVKEIHQTTVNLILLRATFRIEEIPQTNANQTNLLKTLLWNRAFTIIQSPACRREYAFNPYYNQKLRRFHQSTRRTGKIYQESPRHLRYYLVQFREVQPMLVVHRLGMFTDSQMIDKRESQEKCNWADFALLLPKITIKHM